MYIYWENAIKNFFRIKYGSEIKEQLAKANYSG